MRNTATGDTSAAPPEESDLTARLSAEILTYLREENPPIGHRLTERALAERLRVSRSPVRNALRQLHRDGFIERTASGRYLVARSGAGVITAHTVPPRTRSICGSPPTGWTGSCRTGSPKPPCSSATT